MPVQSKEDIHVIIVGAGLGGLLTAILLERAGIHYHVFERAATVKPLGSVLTLNANILPVFKQLGLLEALENIALPMKEVLMYNRQLERIATADGNEYFSRTGYNGLAFSRPELYDLMLSQIPPGKISFNKRVLNVRQEEDRATVIFGDNSECHADIIIGADGAYSAVRQCIYRDLSKDGKLPLSDKEDMETVSVGLYGVTDALDPEKYPDVKSDTAKFISMSGSGIVVSMVSLRGNRFSWGTGHQAILEKVLRDKLAASSWGADQAEEMIQEISDIQVPMGGTLGDLIANTPRDRISKVMLEEKLFETWYHRRVILIGDACHKMTPGAGQGAVNAMQDAVTLVNMLNNIDQFNPATLTELFQDYRNERYPRVKRQITNSRRVQSFVFARTRFQEFVRSVMLKIMPANMHMEAQIAGAVYQPQVAFLPLAVGNPEFKVLPQMVLKRYGIKGANAVGATAFV